MVRILLAGEGGQGVQTIAKILAKAAQKSKKYVSYIPSFGVEQRGGVSLAYIQIDNAPIGFPRFSKAEIVVVFCNRAVEAIKDYFNFGTILIYDSSAIENKYLQKLEGIAKKAVSIPAQKIAKEKYSIKMLNMLILGALTKEFKDIDINTIQEELENELKEKIAKQPEIKEKNFAALKEGALLASNVNFEENGFIGIESKVVTKTFEDDKKTWTRFPEYCKGCNLCIERCPVKALRFSNDVGFLGNLIPEIDLEKCIACGMCERTCPDGAIRIDKK